MNILSHDGLAQRSLRRTVLHRDVRLIHHFLRRDEDELGILVDEFLD